MECRIAGADWAGTSLCRNCLADSQAQRHAAAGRAGADADRAFFSLSGTKNNLTMLIRDNGKGFDTNKSSEGNGLKNMKKRAQEIGAQLFVESGAGIGTTIQFSLKTS